MKRSIFTFFAIIGLLMQVTFVAAATKEMRWSISKTGKKITAFAESLEGGVVTLVKRNGDAVEIPLDHFSIKDRSFLKKHFIDDQKNNKNEDGEDEAGGDAPALKKFPVAQGEVVGPVKVNTKTSYFVYVPESLKLKQRVPLLLITGARGGNGDLMDPYIDYAEMYGWILAVSRQADNDREKHINVEHVSKSINHLSRTLPIDRKRIYLAGHDEGGVIAIEMSEVIGAEGVITNNAYVMQRGKPIGRRYYFMSGATSPIRYATAVSRGRFGKNGIHVFHTKGGKQPEEEFYYDAMYWMHIHSLGEVKSRRPIEAKLFEDNSLEFIEDNIDGDSERAYWKAMLIKEHYKLPEEKAKKLDKMIKELEKEETNKLYVQGLKDLDSLSKKYLRPGGYIRKNNYVDVKLQRASERLLKKYKDTLYIADALENFKKATQ